jgi:predicted  nucleic acid-binding Zn-ribbon protein
VADQRSSLTLEELRLLIHKKERELSELELMLADYHTERSRVIRELRKLQARLCDAEEAASSESI